MPQYPQRIGNYWLLQALGSGYSGSIFRAQHVHTGGIVALKIQDVDHECPTNRYERGFYPYLQGGKGMPTLYSSGIDGQWDYLAMELLGSSLDNLYRKSGKNRMDLRSVCCIAMQMIERLQCMHSRGVLHRDIQLGNTVLGLPPNEQTLYMIDFGFSKIYIDPHTGKHIPDSKHKRDFIGNYWFTSIGVHCRGKVPSRRDDLEAAALMFIHLLTPNGLPWTRNGLPKSDRAHDRIKREKRSARPENLCYGLPPEFEEFLRYCRRLKFAETPDYDYWRNEFRELACASGYPDSDAFVWPPPEPILEFVPLPPANPRPTPGPHSVENILNDIANLRLDDRPVLGERTDVVNAVQHAHAAVAPPAKKLPAPPPPDAHIIEISDSSDDIHHPQVVRFEKARELARITEAAGTAADNTALAALLRDFIAVLNRQRTLTREGSAFLDALHKQLADPSVFIVQKRASLIGSALAPADKLAARQVKLGALAALKRDVAGALGNAELGGMVAAFQALTNGGGNKGVTKDGLAFLDGLARRLEAGPS